MLCLCRGLGSQLLTTHTALKDTKKKKKNVFKTFPENSTWMEQMPYTWKNTVAHWLLIYSRPIKFLRVIN